MPVKRVRSFPLFTGAPRALPSHGEGPPEQAIMDLDGPVRVGSKRVGSAGSRPQQICTFWLEGRCNREPCGFLHAGDPRRRASGAAGSNKRSSSASLDDESVAPAGASRRNTAAASRWGARARGAKGGRTVAGGRRRGAEKACSYFLRGSCTRGQQCSFLHSHSTTPDMSFISRLTGHEKAVRAITLPEGSNKLYTAGQDQTVRVWDCNTGQCSNVLCMGGDVGCMLSKSGWLFAGLPNEVKAWNLQTNSQQSLGGPKGQVHALAACNDMLLAGIQDGSILAWKFSSLTNIFEPAATLCGHTSAVVTLEAVGSRLYSGSMDKSIRVWDLNTGHCLQTLQGHAHVVMDLLSWEQFLLSCSLDGTLKVWGTSQNGVLEIQYTLPEDINCNEVLDGALSLCGYMDQQGKAILLCSYNDNTVRLFELPSFTERGILFSREEVRSLHVGPDGLVFSGDSVGEVKVWKWAPLASATE